jgi:hypothetical protein
VKTLSLSIVLTAVFLGPWDASAQTAPPVRGDVSGTLGVEGVNARDDSFYRGHNFEGGFFGAASAGWYWTENLKSEVEFSARTTGRIWVTEPIAFNGGQTYFPTDKRFSRQTIAIGQQYQFFHNAWFHPHLGAGANFTFERSTLHRAAGSVYDPVTRTSRLVSPERTEPTHTDFRVNPFVEAGFKAYMTPRTFFRSDLRVAFHHGVDDVVTRFGFGFDF